MNTHKRSAHGLPLNFLCHSWHLLRLFLSQRPITCFYSTFLHIFSHLWWQSAFHFLCGLKVVSPHYCIYHEGYFAVNDQHERVWGKKSREATYSRLALHHYITKSVDEFRQKVQKGSGNFKHRAKSFISMIDEKATEKCNPQYLLSIKGRDLEAK